MANDYFSISKIVRIFGMGYNRAGKLFEMLKNDGIVAKEPDTPGSAKGNRVLVHAAPSDTELASDNSTLL